MDTIREFNDLAYGDQLILQDGTSVMVIEAFDSMVKVSGTNRPYIYKSEIRSHYPYTGKLGKNAKKSYDRK